jgi:hypothetical protein
VNEWWVGETCGGFLIGGFQGDTERVLSLFVRVLKNQSGHTEAIKSRYELLLIPAKMVLSGRRKIVKLAVGSKFASFLKQAYQRLEEWLGQTAPQLSLSMGKAPPWLLFDPTQTTSSAVT